MTQFCTVPREHENARRPYQPPVVRRIDLAADEVLAVGCKLNAFPGSYFDPVCFGPHRCRADSS